MEPGRGWPSASLLTVSALGHFPGCLLNTPTLVSHAVAHRPSRGNTTTGPRTRAYSHAYCGAYSGLSEQGSYPGTRAAWADEPSEDREGTPLTTKP